MDNRMRAAVMVAIIGALSAVGLFVARNSLVSARATLAEARASRDFAWEQYLLAEQRGSTITLLTARRDELGVEQAVLAARGMILALESAAGQEGTDPAAMRLLGGPRQPLVQTPFAQSLLAGSDEGYDALQGLAAPLRGAAVQRIGNFAGELSRMERELQPLVNWETVMFMLTVISALLFNVLSTRKG